MIDGAGYGINDLMGQIRNSGGIARGNQFAVTLPQISSFAIDSKELDLMCTAAQLPGRQITSLDFMIGTTNRKIANGFANADLQLTFLVANNHKIRQYFEAWQNEAHNQANGTVGYFDDYTYDVQIHVVERGLRSSLFKRQLSIIDRVPSSLRNRLPDLGPVDLSQGEIDLGVEFNAKKTYTCKLLECYPTTLNDQAVGNGEEGFMELSVQLSYTDWESIPGKYTSDAESLGRGVLGALAGVVNRALG